MQWNDIDYMITQNDFTIDPDRFGGIYQLVDDIHAAGMHYVPILDPGVSASEPSGTYPPYEDGLNMDIFVKDKDGKVFVAKVWNPVSTVFPDFTNPKSQEYWTKQISELYSKLPFDGIWIVSTLILFFLIFKVINCLVSFKGYERACKFP